MELESEYSFVRYYIYIYYCTHFHHNAHTHPPQPPPFPPSPISPPNSISKEIPYYLGTFDNNFIFFRNIENFKNVI
jgi:hypothetical protein